MIACIASVSAGVLRENWDTSKKAEYCCDATMAPLQIRRNLCRPMMHFHITQARGVSLTTINVLVTGNATYRCGLCDNNCGLRNF